MAPNSHIPEAHRTDSTQERLLNRGLYYDPNAGHFNNQSINQSSISRNPAHSYQSDSAAYNYPQQLDYEADPGHVPTKPPILQQYQDVSRAWTSVNSQIHLATHANSLNHDHRTHPKQTYHPYSDRFAAMYVEKRRLTESKLEVHDYMTSPVSSMTRWEQQDHRTGPWDGVGSVRTDQSKRRG